MTFVETDLSGCFEIKLPVYSDPRGKFVKAIATSTFLKQGLQTDFVESFYTVSGPNVLRGMHFQVPPSDHAKLVYCMSGSILDVCLDLRVGSATFGKFSAVELSEKANNAVYMPTGIAHGFLVLDAPAITMYHVTTEHDAMRDQGIAWDSFGMSWPNSSPIVSSRDMQWPALSDFASPFSQETVSATQGRVKK